MATRVMVVDDEEDITTTVRLGLAQHGMIVTVFNDAIEALDNYRPGDFDMILLDIRMPKMTGFELAKSIWKQEKGARICFFTSFEIYESEADKVFPSMNRPCFLRKPMSIDKLAKHIEAQLGLVPPDFPGPT